MGWNGNRHRCIERVNNEIYLRRFQAIKMQVIILLFPLFHLAFPYSLVHEPSMLRALFGNVTEMNDLFLPPLNDLSGEESSLEEEIEIPDIGDYFRKMTIDNYGKDEDVNLTIYDHDLTEFNEISKAVDGLIAPAASPIDFRRYKYKWAKKESDFYKKGLHWDENDGKDIELEKKQRVRDLMLTLIIHIRFKVDMAVRQRERGKRSKGYRLGYLFSHLRRLKYNLARTVNTVVVQEYDRHNIKIKFKRIYNYHQDRMLRTYEKMVRLDVEIRDIIDLIIEVANEVNPSTTTAANFGE